MEVPVGRAHEPDLVDPEVGRIDTLPRFRRTVADAGLEGSVVALVGDSPTVGRHWRIPLSAALHLQDGLMGWLPGYATPRLVCDVPYAGKRWVHQFVSYDRERGISVWPGSAHPYYDPIHTLPEAGRRWWSASPEEAPDVTL